MSDYTKNSLIIPGVLTLILVIITGLMLIFPQKARLDVESHDATIVLTANRNWVWNADDCVTLSWMAGNINAIYINGRGTTGEGMTEFCRTSTQSSATIRADYRDGESEEFSLEIPLVWQVPVFWLMAGLIILCLFGMVYVLISPALKQPDESSNRLKPVFSVLRFLFINLVIIGILLEIGLRLYFGNLGTEEQKAMYLYSLQDLRRETTVGALPFLNYGLGGEIVNNLGYRDLVDREIPKPDGIYRIAVLGGSTTFGLLMDRSQPYPERLERILHNNYGYTNIEVVNAGVIGYDTWNSLVNLSFRVLELEPDMIIIYHAMNDMHPREQLLPECYRGMNLHRGINAEAAVLQLDAQWISPSALHRFVFINFGWMDNPRSLEGSLEQTIPCYYESLESNMTAAERVANNPPVYFERNMRTMLTIAQGYDMDVMLATWAYDNNAEGQYAESYWQAGIAEHNAITAQLAEEYSTLFLDFASSAIADDSTYWLDDYVHQSIEGHIFQAELFAEYLISTGILPENEN